MKDKENILLIRSDRLKKIMTRYNLIQADIYKTDRFNRSEVSEWVNGKRPITYEKGKDLIRECFPEVSIEYLMGDSDYMTVSDQLNEVLMKCASETELLNPSVINLLRLSGYTVKCYYEDGVTKSGSVNKMIDEIKNYCSISKDGRTKVFSISQFNKLANLVCDYTDFVAQTTL